MRFVIHIVDILLVLLILQLNMMFSFKRLCLPKIGLSKRAFNRVLAIPTRSFFFQESPIQEVEVFSRKIFIKRDDLCRLEPDIGISGNKVRKLQTLIECKHFPKTVISDGGSQSNAMRALALLCSQKGARFVYLCRKIPQTLKVTPVGNYLDALNAGMEVISSRNILYLS